MTLKSIWDVASKELQPVQTAATKSAAAEVVDEKTEIELVPAALREKFISYIEKLKETTYFQDIVPNTPAYAKRVRKAREKFMRKYGGEEQQGAAMESEPKKAAPASTADVDAVAKAEALKNQGNEKLKNQDFAAAIELYTAAIDIHPCAVYYSNRAAARQYLNQHQLALEDAQMSVAYDPRFFKGYMRIGHSLFALGKFEECIEKGYRKALEIQPNDQSALSCIEDARKEINAKNNAAPPNVNANANAGANPMAGMAGMFNNPNLMRMAEQLRGGGGGAGGGMPSMADLMNNPELMQAAVRHANEEVKFC